jgi:hypothetical protein
MSFEPTLSPEQEAELTSNKIFLPMEAGEAILIDNLMLHRSDPNTTGKIRRGFSIWYTRAEPPLAQIFPDYVPHTRYYPDPNVERSDGGYRDQLPPTGNVGRL